MNTKNKEQYKFKVATDVGCFTLIPLEILKKYNAKTPDGDYASNVILEGTYKFKYENYIYSKPAVRTLSLIGEFYFGDPCLCIPEELWLSFCDNELDNKNTSVIIFNTGGDGLFEVSIKKQ